jgi:UDP-2-acetamido-3-amino-2,3-dideoxy-glucuronate N-acetyltransferase
MNQEPRAQNDQPRTTNHELRTIRVAILGSGGWGKNLVRVFCELLGEASVTVIDPDPSRVAAMSANHPGIVTAGHPEWGTYDAVVIAAPAILHHDLAKQALESGAHVLVEKPMALTSEHARELIAIAETQGRILMVDHLLEYHPAVTRLKEMVRNGRLGRLLHLTSRRLNLGVIRTEENALWSLAPHDISVILYLLDEQPLTVSAHGGTFLQEDIPDIAYLTMTFPSGAVGHVHASWLDPIKTRCLVAVGDGGMAVYDDTAAERLIYHDKRAVRDGTRFVPERGPDEAIALDPAEPLRSMAEAFLYSVRTGEPPRADGQDGLRVVRVLEAAQRSMETGGTPVRMEIHE